jgi:lysophospholipase L1-like esterase
VPANAAKLIINSRISKGEAGVYKTPTINERLNLVMLESGSFLTAARNATNGAAFDGRSMFNYDPSTLQGKIVKIRFECDDSIFPNGLYWMSGNGKYLSGSAQLYKPNTDYYVAVGDSFATSGNKYSGLYGAASLVQGSGAVTAYFYPEFESSRGYLQYQINNWHGNVQNIVADMLCWGDSLTAGAGGDGTTYPTVCASELGISVRNCGVGGETGNTIAARQGGNTVVIPAGAINGTYSSLTDIYGTQIAPLLQGNGNGSGNKLYINGEECSLSYNNGTYTISGYTGEASIVPLLGRFSGSNFHGRIVTIWCGANGARIGNDTGVTARIAIIDSMIRQIGHEQFVIFGNWTSTGTEEDFTDDDAAMLAHYGNKFFNVRKMLVDYGLTLMNITPTTQDETDIADGRIPSSLRSDSVHLNANGYTAVGKFLADKIRSLGYV